MRGKSRLLQTIIQLINTSTKLIDANLKKKKKEEEYPESLSIQSFFSTLVD